jgi:hypothetical protein
MTCQLKCSACKTHIKSPLLIGGMEVNLCEHCQPYPARTKKQEAPRDEYDYHED